MFESVSIRGFGVFKDAMTFSFDELNDARTIAVCGENGAGKSSFLELMYSGSWYRSTPTRGSLKDLAITRDAELETTFSINGKRYTVKHLQDAVSGKGEAIVLSDGVPVYGSTKVTEFTKWATEYLPPAEVVFAGLFGAQAAGGFLAAKPAERKSILLRALGAEHYEAMSQAAGENFREVAHKVETLTQRIADAAARANVAQPAAKALLLVELERSKSELKAAQDALHDARGRAQEAEALRFARRQYEDKVDVHRRAIADITAKVVDTEQRIARCKEVLAKEPRIREAAADLAETERRIAELTVRERELARQDELTLKEANAAAAELERKRIDCAKYKARLDGVNERLEKAHEILAAESWLNMHKLDVTELEEEIARGQHTLEALQAQQHGDLGERIMRLRTGLEDVGQALSLDNAKATAVVALAADERELEKATEQPRRVAALKKELREKQTKLQELRVEVEENTKLAALADTIQSLTEQREQLAADLGLAREAEASAQQVADSLAAQAAINPTVGVRGQLKRESARADSLRELGGQVNMLDVAKAKLGEREQQLAALVKEDKAHRLAIAELREPPPPPEVYLVPLELHLEMTQTVVKDQEVALSLLNAKLEEASKAQQMVEALSAERADLELEQADWKRLQEDLGKKGIQAAEIDGAGPELTETANALLHACYGTRFSVRIDTQRLAADGKRMLEGCDVTVMDTQNGREAEGSTYSGGERTIISEAIALSITALSCKRLGITQPLIVRDESAAALSPEHAGAYVPMLNRACELLDARAMFVSHSPEVSGMADARLIVKDGRLSVERGLMEAA